MSKKLVQASDKVINRYSKKTGLQQVNIKDNQVHIITKKIQDIELNRSITNDTYKSYINTNNDINTNSRTQGRYKQNTNTTNNEYNSQNINSNKYALNDMAYNKENLNNTYEGQFRTQNKNLGVNKALKDNTYDNSIRTHKNKIDNQKILQEENSSIRFIEKENSQSLQHNNYINVIRQSDDRLNIKNSQYHTSKIVTQNSNTFKKMKYFFLKDKDSSTTSSRLINKEDRVNNALQYDKYQDSLIKQAIEKRVLLENKKIKDFKINTHLKSKKEIENNKNIKSNKKSEYKRLRFDDELKEKTDIKVNKNRLKEKSNFSSSLSKAFRMSEDDIFSKTVESSDDLLTDTSKTLRETKNVVRDSKSAFKTIRKSYNTIKSKSKLKKNSKLSNKKSVLKHGRNTTETKGVKELQKKAIKKQNAKKLREALKKKAQKKAADAVSNGAKSLALVAKKALVTAASSIISAIGLPAAIISSIVICCALFVALLLGTYTQVFAYTYQAKDKDITEVNQYFVKKELELESKAYNPPSGYDGYRYHIDPIGHQSDELIAYFSIKYYQKGFSFNKVRGELDSIFDETYKYRTWVEEIEKKETYTDSEGETRERTIILKILHIEVKSKNLTSVLKGRLEDNKKIDYDRFRELKGCFQVMNQPLDSDYKSLVRKKYGYQFELNSTTNIEYSDSMDIYTTDGEKIYAVIAGKVRKGSDKDGSYLEIYTNKDYRVRYYNISYDSSLKEVEAGDILGQATTITLQNGQKDSFLKMKILDKWGNTLDPYYYLFSKIDGEPSNAGIIKRDLIANINATGSAKEAIEIAKSFEGKNGAYMFPNFITPMTGHTMEEWCADFCAATIAYSIGGSIRGNTIYDKDGKPFMNWSAGVSNWADYAAAAGILRRADGSYTPKPGDLILSYGNHIEMIADTSGGITTIGGNTGSGFNSPAGRKVSIKYNSSLADWAQWYKGGLSNTYIIEMPYKSD